MTTSTDLPRLAVTGSTGAIGGLVATQLAADRTDQRLLARDPSRAPALDGAVAVPSSYSDRALAERSLQGVDVLFMVSAKEAPDRVAAHRSFVDAATAAGVEHIVYTSFFGAAADCTFTFGRDHFATEQHIKRSGMGYTFLRNNSYLDSLPALVGEDGVIRGPAGDGRVAAVARADIARVAVAVLKATEQHRHKTYNLTGPQALSMQDIANALTELEGRPISYQNETIEQAYRSRLRWPAEQWQYDAWVSNYLAIGNGELDGVSDDVATVSGQCPTTLHQLLDRRPSRG